MIHPSIQPLLPEIIALLKKHRVTSAYLFGSVLTEKFNEQSDIDFLVNIQTTLDPSEAGGHLWELIDELEALLQRKVDLLTERSLRNPFFIKKINETKLAIYGY